MTRESREQTESREFLPLGSIVILKGSVKKLLIVSRGSIVEGAFFDYGAFLYPEGMIDTNIAYFNHEDILKIVHEGYSDDDNELVLEILNEAYARFQLQEHRVATATATAPGAAAEPPLTTTASNTDLFASVRDGMDDDA